MAYTTIDNPSEYFQPVTFTGSTSNITVNIGMRPDWFWFKSRTQTYSHLIYDTSRPSDGTSMPSGDVNMYNALKMDKNVAESDNNADGLVQTSTGFIVDGDGQAISEANQGADNMATYCWKANGGTTTSGAGNDSVSTSAHQADTTAGFSIVTWTGNGSDNATVKHGLSVKPKMILTKRRDDTGHWYGNNWVSEQDYAQKLKWNDTDAQTSSNDFVKSADSNVFTLGTDADVNANNGTYVGYCFAEIQGYQHFGQYTGNGNAEGPFIYTGFAPAFVIVKRWDDTTSWHLYDSGRQDFNDAARPTFKVNGSDADFDKAIDFCASGFKIRDTTSDANVAGGAYVYWAIAKRPFVSSEGVVGTAI
tara:strand:- start:73 stop:1158 length:1086 start_codon:yes stop_codon:yes gene_type:complete